LHAPADTSVNLSAEDQSPPALGFRQWVFDRRVFVPFPTSTGLPESSLQEIRSPKAGSFEVEVKIYQDGKIGFGGAKIESSDLPERLSRVMGKHQFVPLLLAPGSMKAEKVIETADLCCHTSISGLKFLTFKNNRFFERCLPDFNNGIPPGRTLISFGQDGFFEYSSPRRHAKVSIQEIPSLLNEDEVAVVILGLDKETTYEELIRLWDACLNRKAIDVYVSTVKWKMENELDGSKLSGSNSFKR
jgi:biopolymer transport protein ExbD